MNQKHLHIAIAAAVKAGEAIMEIYESPQAEWQVEQKSDHSPLTLADRRSHEVIAAALEDTGIPVLSEEGRHMPYEERRQWDILWVVDPLDGTKEFIKRNGEFTVNIALVRNGEPVAGIIFVPVSRVLYCGVVGESAFRAVIPSGCADVAEVEKEEIHAGKLAKTTVVASRSHMNADTEAFIEALRAEGNAEIEVVSAGSSLKFCLVAEGKADYYPRYAPTMEWDTAAGHAICLAAGASVAQPDGAPLRYNRQDLLNPYFLVKACR
ncbi:MAG: 3'(2'),5'-bisphosphate nucleotidase CysQ [Alloprevotella sp.]